MGWLLSIVLALNRKKVRGADLSLEINSNGPKPSMRFLLRADMQMG
jgi:hypothetical protein